MRSKRIGDGDGRRGSLDVSRLLLGALLGVGTSLPFSFSWGSEGKWIYLLFRFPDKGEK